MEKELNIAAVLKEKPKGTKLWSPIFGECELAYICEKELEYVPIRVTKKKFGTAYFEKDGKSHKDGDCILFPSKKMPNWSKFAWKKGDVLQISDVGFCTFEAWTSDDYTTFKGRYGVNFGKNRTYGYYISKEDLNTFMWYKVDDDNLIKQYLDEVEQQIGGKLNLETLEIEHPKQEFKDGDVLYVEKNKLFPSCVFIYQDHEYSDEEDMYCFALFDYYRCKVDICSAVTIDNRNVRRATKEEKEELFEHLKNEGKRWNPDTKQIEDLPKKCEFKAFDKVLVRDYPDDKWMPNFFSCYDETSEYKYGCIAGNSDNTIFSKYCIPYNDETKHILGTTDEWKGGRK